MKDGSVGFVETAVERVGLFFVARKAGAQRFIKDARASNRHVLNPPCGPVLTGEGLCNLDFQGAPEDAQNWFVGSTDIKNAFHQMRILVGRKRFFCTARCSRIRSLSYGKNDQSKKDLLPIS